tara:strand:+ start:276 stop:971 length:696 start_codon:yes stop_codon:yes gene_type:complete
MPEWYQNPGEGTFVPTTDISLDPMDYVRDFLHEDEDEGLWEQKYGMYFDPYDPTMEQFVDKELLASKNTLMEDLVSSKNNFQDSVRKGSFAGSYVEDTEDFYDEAYRTAKALDLGLQQEKFGFRKDWQSDVYTMLGKLAEMEAFELQDYTEEEEVIEQCNDSTPCPGTLVCVDGQCVDISEGASDSSGDCADDEYYVPPNVSAGTAGYCRPYGDPECTQYQRDYCLDGCCD